MSKMYLQHDNGGYGLLITDDAGHWYYWQENDLPVTLNARNEDGRLDNDMNAAIIRKAIADYEMYDADEFVSECENEQINSEHYISAYDGMQDINAVSAYENDNRDFDFTEYTEI